MAEKEEEDSTYFGSFNLPDLFKNLSIAKHEPKAPQKVETKVKDGDEKRETSKEEGKPKSENLPKVIKPKPRLPEAAERFAEHLKKANNVIVMVGAGVSVSAGIPDFRTPGTGLYSQLAKYQLPHRKLVLLLKSNI